MARQRIEQAASLPASPADAHAGAAGAATAVATVRMRRDPGTNPEPHAIDVHPDEVTNYQRAGWQLTE
ncbi:MAG: hypothetical protein EKK62_03975 [Acidimicrobiia bacterium]|nr:MAG: hypothetical protein EKK62_03975 [Acidimicrobiia bacterium]